MNALIARGLELLQGTKFYQIEAMKGAYASQRGRFRVVPPEGTFMMWDLSHEWAAPSASTLA